MYAMFKRLYKFYSQQNFEPCLIGIFVNPSYFSRKYLYQGVRKYSKELEGRILDFGCGSKPYRKLFTKATEYIGIDFQNTGHDHRKENIDIFYDGKHLPFPDNSFDAIVCTEVFEHIADVEKIVIELRRVLKTNGRLLLTVPFVYKEHDMPYDYRRYTMNGIVTLLEDKNFIILSKEKLGNFIETIFQLWALYMNECFFCNSKYVNVFVNFFLLSPFIFFGVVLNLLLPKKTSLYIHSIVLCAKL